jgi:hypothetical protein
MKSNIHNVRNLDNACIVRRVSIAYMHHTLCMCVCVCVSKNEWMEGVRVILHQTRPRSNTNDTATSHVLYNDT